jgi:hypothetical protein
MTDARPVFSIVVTGLTVVTSGSEVWTDDNVVPEDHLGPGGLRVFHLATDPVGAAG